ncbi:unnamed protein product [Mucor circinelloides]|uniref:Uncharacterized protein n=1 Tax=Mucor circinelloides f. circinelloides (strain 1006PhL) TaxID=1220926 RepID=S2KKI2_MUCC1|nr:hypothetical protein HMPREF1544_00329 [Mucor circinelloides 1006PhL]
MVHSIKTLYNRIKAKKSTSAATDYDEDYLVDYEDIPQHKKISKELITKQIEKCKQKLEQIKRPTSATSSLSSTEHYNYKLNYSEKGSIQRPTYYVESTGEIYYIPITMDVIRSVVLKQHCHITKQEELVWFEDGIKWLSQQQYQNKSNTSFRYYIEEEKNYTGWDEKRTMLQHDIEDLERACEAYFGIPLGLCEDHWAAEYLMSQASKAKLLRRVNLQPSLRKVKFSLKRMFCCGL